MHDDLHNFNKKYEKNMERLRIMENKLDEEGKNAMIKRIEMYKHLKQLLVDIPKEIEDIVNTIKKLLHYEFCSINVVTNYE